MDPQVMIKAAWFDLVSDMIAQKMQFQMYVKELEAKNTKLAEALKASSNTPKTEETKL